MYICVRVLLQPLVHTFMTSDITCCLCNPTNKYANVWEFLPAIALFISVYGHVYMCTCVHVAHYPVALLCAYSLTCICMWYKRIGAPPMFPLVHVFGMEVP